MSNMQINMNDLRILKEKLEILTGERGDPQLAAIRVRVLGQLQELISKLRISATELQNDINTLDLGLQSTQSQLDTVQTNVGTLQTDVAALDGNVSTLQSSVTTLQGDIATIQTDLSTAQTTLSQLDADIAALQTDVGGFATLSDNFDQIQTDVTAVSIPGATQGAVAAPPTAAEFNQLLSDVNALRTALTDLKNAIII